MAKGLRQMEEFQLTWPHISSGGFLISDDVSQNDAFLNFADQVKKKYIIIKKQNGNHYGIIQK